MYTILYVYTCFFCNQCAFMSTRYYKLVDQVLSASGSAGFHEHSSALSEADLELQA